MTKKHPVDVVPPAGQLAVLSIQHVLAFYAGAVIVPLVISQALKLDEATTIHLINADLFTCGIATIIQSVGIWKIGVRLPLIQGVTFTAVSPIIAIGLSAPEGHGLPQIYGSIIISGIFTFLAAPYFAKLIRFFPPVVTGTVLTIMGVTLISVSAGDIAGQDPTATPLGKNLAYALGTLALIVLVQRVFKGFMATISVLIGLVVGTGVALVLGDASFSNVANSPYLGVTTPFYFGWPEFSLMGAISMIIVMAITMVETTGDVFAAGEVVDKRITANDITAALRADGVSTLLGGVLNSFPYTCFAQNVGLVRLTRVSSRWVVAAAGGIMIVLGLIPKAGAVVAAIPHSVLGGASIAMFANVAIVGIQTLSRVNMRDDKNAVIVSTSLGLAMLVTLRPGIANTLPSWATILFASGITLGSLSAIFLNLIFNHLPPTFRSKVTRTSKDGRGYTLEELNQSSVPEFVGALSDLFNTVTWPLERVAASGPFESTESLATALQATISSASASEKVELIKDYPDMEQLLFGSPEEGVLTKDRGSLALGDLTSAEQEILHSLCQGYQEKFGYPFVARLTPSMSFKDILAQGAVRMDHEPSIEANRAIMEICEITLDRYGELLADANPVGSSWARKFEALD
ncbi:uracil-xanthine permease [Boudabousia liubingyangii]|uniref:Uracil-xanthine permease n=1 Tax=Boudabousia liubingyangii TaxID=1921764 RepID=A0A1Q5PNL1_9ACTO|nr:solute carrier family 23 protein [Boudabousia liubingyangii]OKL47700.1 uracil-xanthine permease [Boudabousia liubingyangii]OKL49126.1 uracil-xanthine permease [Boudabousia liubingyangii]